MSTLKRESTRTRRMIKKILISSLERKNKNIPTNKLCLTLSICKLGKEPTVCII